MAAPIPDPGASVLPSIVRTVVPYLIGLIGSFLAARGLGLDENAKANLTGLLTFGIGSIYYVVVRAVEKSNPSAGWFLGVPKAPVYTPPVV